jgi:hypothetical protein
MVQPAIVDQGEAALDVDERLSQAHGDLTWLAVAHGQEPCADFLAPTGVIRGRAAVRAPSGTRPHRLRRSSVLIFPSSAWQPGQWPV